MTPVLEAQNTAISLWEETLEELSIGEEEEKSWENELEELSERLQQPLNLNTVTKQELEQFPFLTDIQIENLLAYVYIHGQMQTLYELQLVEEMDKHTLELLLPFVCVQATSKTQGFPHLKTLFKQGKQEILTRLDIPFYTRQGYQKNYLGTPQYHSLRYSFRSGEYLQWGISAEKDAGEPFFALHNNKGYDLYSIYFILHDIGKFKTIALGNYRLSFGQGLVVSTDFCFGKSYSLFMVENRAGGIRKHSSTDEYNYFQGLATTIKLADWLHFSAFYSHRSMDGVVEDGQITSIYKTGLHRTEKEATKKGAYTLQLGGGNLSYAKNRLQVGITGIYYFFNHPYEPTLRTYAKYNLHGNNFYNVGIDYKYRFHSFTFMGESAVGKQGYAFINKLKFNILTDYQLLLIHRYYTHDYWALFARSFSENNTPQNENGWYLAAEAAPVAHWNFFASLDLCAFPWWKYRVSKPSQAIESRFQATYTPREILSMYLNYRYQQKERDLTGTSGATILPTYQHRVRYRLTYKPVNWQLRTTMDYTHFHSQGQERSEGFQLVQSCAHTLISFPLTLSIQGSYFHTDDYDSRVYASEKGLLYTFYTPSFSGEGFRFSACARYDCSSWLMLLVKFGETTYQDRETIGSGNDLIHGHKKADLQMQLRMKF